MAMPRMRSWDVSEANERNIKKHHHIFTVDDVPSYLIILRSALQFPHAVWLISIFGQIKVFLRHSKCKFLTDTTDTCFRGTKRRVLHGRILSNEFMLAISTIVWSGVILLVWNTHVHYFMIYTEREREREMTSTQTYQWQFQKFQILQVPGHFFQARVAPQLTCTAAIPSPGRWAWKIACKIRYVWYANVCSCWNICTDRYQCHAILYWLYMAILFNFCFWMLITCASQPPRIVHFLQDFLKEWPSPKDEDARFAGVLKGCLSHKIQKRSPK